MIETPIMRFKLCVVLLFWTCPKRSRCSAVISQFWQPCWTQSFWTSFFGWFYQYSILEVEVSQQRYSAATAGSIATLAWLTDRQIPSEGRTVGQANKRWQGKMEYLCQRVALHCMQSLTFFFTSWHRNLGKISVLPHT